MKNVIRICAGRVQGSVMLRHGERSEGKGAPAQGGKEVRQHRLVPALVKRRNCFADEAKFKINLMRLEPPVISFHVTCRKDIVVSSFGRF